MERRMNINQKATTMDRKGYLSIIWIFAALNYLYCDVVALMDSELLRQYFTGNVNGMEFTQGFLLGAAILVEIPIAMVLLSRVLKYRVNRVTVRRNASQVLRIFQCSRNCSNCPDCVACMELASR
jgi:hypothetical protein